MLTDVDQRDRLLLDKFEWMRRLASLGDSWEFSNRVDSRR